MDYDPASDLQALEAMAANLAPYLYGKELYGTLGPNLPKLTVGGLLLRLYRLQGLESSLSHDQQKRLQAAAAAYEKTRAEWSVHYEGKLQQEIKARVNNLTAFLEDHAEDAGKARADHPTAATQRTILYHLRQEAERLNQWTPDLAALEWKLDKRLRGVLGSGQSHFIWAKSLEPLYPAEIFWWLYGSG